MNYRRYSAITMRAIQKSSRKDISSYMAFLEREIFFTLEIQGMEMVGRVMMMKT